MSHRFLPRNERFYDLFENSGKKVLEGAVQLENLIKHFKEDPLKAKQIKDTDHEGDLLTHSIIEMLNRTFVTPLDREDIHNIITVLEDVLDYVEACAERLNLFKVKSTNEESMILVDILVRSVREVEQAISKLRRLKGTETIMKNCIEIGRLENEGDNVCRAAVAKLFEVGNDPLEVIKWKEIYETLEKAIDRCEDVANVLEGIALNMPRMRLLGPGCPPRRPC